MSRIFTQQEIETIFEKFEEPNCWSYQQIADLIGVERLAVARIIGKSFQTGGTAGMCNGHHVLTNDDVKKMRELYQNSDMSYRDIAIEFCVAKSTALRAIKGQCWRNVE